MSLQENLTGCSNKNIFHIVFLIIGGGDLTCKSQVFITTFNQNLHKSVVDLRGNFSV